MVGGVDLLKSVGLCHLAQKRLGERGDLLAVGGRKSKGDAGWKDSSKVLSGKDKKKIVALTVEIGVTIVMCTHVYQFCGKFYLQVDGGPIGLRSTATLAALIMKLWDQAWIKLLIREGFFLLLYFRYVDDSRTFGPPLAEGWRWDTDQFKFKDLWYAEDINSGKTDQERTTCELVKAMSSLVSYLEFEGEEGGMFPEGKLPTLDTKLWWDGVSVKYEFFEKDMCTNLVLQKDTALSTSCIRSSLTQEVVRRLMNCSRDLPIELKQAVLSKFAQKLLNSKHSVSSSKIILVHGVTRYNELCKRSDLPSDHRLYQPLHFDKSFKKDERRLRKFIAASNWYHGGVETKVNWRSQLPTEWRGASPIQFKLPGVDYSTILQVPSSKNSRLLRALSRIEPRLAKSTKYHVKLVERSGKPLAKLFSTDFSDGRCGREDCKVCSNPDLKGPSMCMVSNVVYESVCSLCDERHKADKAKPHQGRYVGETSRTMYERAGEHEALLG